MSLRTTLQRIALVAAAAVLAACTSTTHRAPVEERTATPKPSATTPSPVVPPPVAAASAPTDPAKPPPPGIENAGKPGYVTIKPGDTLIRIGLENGQNWRDIARWNGIENPNLIEVGQVVRVVPPTQDPSVAVTKPITTGKVDTKPLGAPGAASGPASGATPPVAPAPQSPPPVAAKDPDEDLGWVWPAAGSVTTPFDEAKNKGVGIAGKAGDPVVAAADGRVVYAGSGLRGYGNLIIVKHNATFLSAYAHNQALLVKEDQVVRKGQKIAEMGSSDAERVQLHFEIRRQGKPVDPTKLLPPR